MVRGTPPPDDAAVLRRLHDDAETAGRAALAAVQPRSLMRGRLRFDGGCLRGWGAVLPLGPEPGLAVLAVGKAARAMSQAVAELVPRPPLGQGLLVAPADGETRPEGFRTLVGGHPLPDRRSLAASREARRWLATEVPASSAVLILLSGGGSALLCRPAPSLRLADKIAVTARLLAAGATIGEINCVRRHLSVVKGGGLLRWLGGRPALTLALSDVAGDRLADIAGGPTVADPTTHAQAEAVLRRHALWEEMPSAVRTHLRAGQAGRRPETVKPGEPGLDLPPARVIGGPTTAAAAAAAALGQAGYVVRRMDDEAADSGGVAGSVAAHLAALRGWLAERPASPLALVSVGEAPVAVSGTGRGGRCSEWALQAAAPLAELGWPAVAVALATDGVDGPSGGGGARVDSATLRRADRIGLDVAANLCENDSASLLERLGDLLPTRPTDTNVTDLRMVLVHPPVVGGW